MKTVLRVVYAAPGAGWGRLFTQEERNEEISVFRKKFSKIKRLFPGVEFVEEELRTREVSGKSRTSVNC